MSQNQSKSQPTLLDENQLIALTQTTHYTPAEIKILYHKFVEISAIIINDQGMNLQKFQKALGLTSSEFAQSI
jgi:hypothetical protein